MFPSHVCEMAAGRGRWATPLNGYKAKKTFDNDGCKTLPRGYGAGQDLLCGVGVCENALTQRAATGCLRIIPPAERRMAAGRLALAPRS